MDGVYDSDPEKNPNAKKFDQLTFTDALQRKLSIMDLTAFTLCQENNLPIIVFDMNQKGNLMKLMKGSGSCTLVSNG